MVSYGHPLREELQLIAATSERSLPLQVAAEVSAASKIAKTLADLDGSGTNVGVRSFVPNGGNLVRRVE